MLSIVMSQEAVARQLKQNGTDQVSNQLTDQVDAVGENSDGNKHCGKKKEKCSNYDQGHFRGDKKCSPCDQACITL